MTYWEELEDLSREPTEEEMQMMLGVLYDDQPNEDLDGEISRVLTLIRKRRPFEYGVLTLSRKMVRTREAQIAILAEANRAALLAQSTEQA